MSRLSPHIALISVFLCGVLIVLVEQPRNLAGLALLAGAYWLSAPNRRYALLVLLVLLLGTWSIMLTQGLFYQGWPRTVVITLIPGRWIPLGDPPGLHLFREGLIYGLLQSLRLDTMILLGAGILGRYATDELTRGLHALRLPPVAGFLFSVAMRYLPNMVREFRTIWIAQRMRGFRPWALRANPAGAWPAGHALLVPLLAATLRKSEEIAAALQSRGFSAADSPVDALPRAGTWERLLALTASLGVVALLWASVMTRLHVTGVYSIPWLNGLYRLVSAYV